MNRLTTTRGFLALLVTVPTLAFAQQETPPTGYPQYGYPQPTYPQPTYPQPTQYGNPNQPYPGAQPYPGGQPNPGAQPYPNQPYPGAQPYPNQPYPNQPYPGSPPSATGYPNPAPYPGQADPQRNPASSAQTATETKLVLTASSEEAKNALSACLDAMDHFRQDVVRQRCSEAIEKDDKLALAHALLAQSSGQPLVQKRHLTAAKEITRPVSEGERLLIEGMIALAEDQRQVARAAFEAMAALLPADKHAHYYRGLLRYRFGDLDGAQTDLKKTLELDGKFGPAHNALGHLALRRDNVEEAAKEFAKYVELHPKEPNAHDSHAMLLLRKGELGAAVEAARKSLEVDAKFLRGNLRLGDALLLQGNPLLARKAYSAVLSSPDPSEHHEAALRLSRSRLFEGLGLPTPKALQEAEKDLLTELELSKKLSRRADQVQTLLELARLQFERGAQSDAVKTIGQIRELLPSDQAAADDKNDSAKPTDKALADKAAPTLTDEEKSRFAADLLWLRALLLYSIGERDLAKERADDIEKTLRGKPGQRSAEDLRGELAARSGDRQKVVEHLSQSTRPTGRLALALALGGGKPGEQIDMPKARTMMEELGRRNVIDLEGALTRGRAKQWLRQNPAEKVDGKSSETKP